MYICDNCQKKVYRDKYKVVKRTDPLFCSLSCLEDYHKNVKPVRIFPRITKKGKVASHVQ